MSAPNPLDDPDQGSDMIRVRATRRRRDGEPERTPAFWQRPLFWIAVGTLAFGLLAFWVFRG